MRVQKLVDAGGLPPDSITDTLQNPVSVMPDINISLNGLFKLLKKNLKHGKAAGPDKLKPLLLNEISEEIASIIKILFERSLQTGKLPAEWMTANVMLVFKKGEKSLAVYYRPISLAFSARFLNMFLHQIKPSMCSVKDSCSCIK